VKVGAQAKSVDVLAQLDDDMVVDERANVDESGIAVDGVREVRPV
jgi:hypothetical protein